MRQIKRILRKLLTGLGIKGPLSLAIESESILVQEGWYRSHHRIESVDRLGRPIPWCTYAFLHFIEPRLEPEFRIFEYGSGNSTVWYAERVGTVIAVEHDTRWAAEIAGRLPANGKVIFRPLGEGYVAEINAHGQFDIVIIDGRLREACAEPALAALKPAGVIVWDNSDRAEFAAGKALFRAHGFRELSFYGLVPINISSSQTSILYRDNNCLDI